MTSPPHWPASDQCKGCGTDRATETVAGPKPVLSASGRARTGARVGSPPGATVGPAVLVVGVLLASGARAVLVVDAPRVLVREKEARVRTPATEAVTL
jgi:hypothetical protein